MNSRHEIMVFYSPINALFPLMSFHHFGGTTTMASISEIALSLGMLAGGTLLGVWGGFKNRSYTIVLSLALMGGAIAVSGLLPTGGFVFFAVMCVLMDISAPFYSGPQMSLMQEKIPPQFLGRVFGLYGSIMALAMPIGLGISGLFTDRLGVNHWFVLSVTACLLLALVTPCFKSVRDIEKA